MTDGKFRARADHGLNDFLHSVYDIHHGLSDFHTSLLMFHAQTTHLRVLLDLFIAAWCIPRPYAYASILNAGGEGLLLWLVSISTYLKNRRLHWRNDPSIYVHCIRSRSGSASVTSRYVKDQYSCTASRIAGKLGKISSESLLARNEVKIR